MADAASAEDPTRDRLRFWILITMLSLIGLVIRLFAAQGALWLDEARSAAAAADVGTPLGVFLQINHDNNHHLNTLWLQLVGLDAPPMLQRALSIACGTLAIPVAAGIGSRQSLAVGICAALLFAISPLLVTYGAEARGYAPMLLALLVIVLVVTRWLDDPFQRVPAVSVALAVLFGMLSQVAMAFGVAALVPWIGWTLLRQLPPRQARRRAGAILLPILLAAIVGVTIVFGAAQAAGTGTWFENHEPFQFGVVNGIGAVLLATFGGPIALLAALMLVAPPDRPSDNANASRDRLLFLLLLTIPFGIAILRIANSLAAGYFMLAGVGALMLVAAHSGPRLIPGRRLRWPITVLFGLIVLASLITDWRMIGNRRGDPGVALEVIASIAPSGAAIAVDRERSTAVLRAAAASRHYPLGIVQAPCPAARFLFIDRDGTNPFPDPAVRCGTRYRVIAEGNPTGLSGTRWKLYERN